MKSAASPMLPPDISAPVERAAPRVVHRSAARSSASDAPRPPGRLARGWAAARRWANKASADFWLSFFFWHARRQPWFARGTKPFFLYFVWRYSEHLYGGTMANAAHILGPQSTIAEREKLAWDIIGNFYDVVCDVGLCLGLSPRQMVQRVDKVVGSDVFDAVRSSGATAGKGAIVATAHMGSFEIGAAALMEREKRLHVLFHRDKLDLFEQIRSTLRKKIGVTEVAVDEGWTVWMRLRDALARDEVVLIQGDRVMPGQKGQPVPFFDGHIQLPTGPVRLAMVTGSPIIPVFSVRMPTGKIRLFIEPPIVIGTGPGEVCSDEAMNRLGAALEKYVTRYPGQWLENRPVWLEDAGKPQMQPPMKRKIADWKATWLKRTTQS